MTRKFVLHAQEVKLDGNKSFIKCSAEINNKWYRIKFNKICDNLPKVKGLYDITVDDVNVSLQKGKNITLDSGKVIKEQDVLWISKCELRHWTDEEMQAKTQLELNGVFDELKPTDESTPF